MFLNILLLDSAKISCNLYRVSQILSVLNVSHLWWKGQYQKSMKRYMLLCMCWFTICIVSRLEINSLYIHLSMHAFIHAGSYVHTHVCTCTHTYTCTLLNTHTHTHTHTHTLTHTHRAKERRSGCFEAFLSIRTLLSLRLHITVNF